MKVICSMTMTADGLIAGPEGQSISSSLDWATFREEATYYNNFIVGRRTLEASEPALTEVGCRFKIIVSTKKNLQLPSGFIAAASPQAALDALKDQVEEAYLVGGAEVNSSFAAHGLIDELVITVAPQTIGSGIKLFSPKAPALQLELIETQALPGDRVKLRYHVKPH